MVSIMKFWTPLLMAFLYMVLLSVLGELKEKSAIKTSKGFKIPL